MVLETLVTPLEAEHRPWQMLFLGALFSSVSIVLSLAVFRDHASLISVFLTVIACIPIFYNTIKLEERKDETIASERILLREHGKALSVFMFLFLGITLAYTLWYLALPTHYLDVVFGVQENTIQSINSKITGNSTSTDLYYLKIIFFNNLKVMLFCLVFAFIYGFGALFILTWNASVISVAIGKIARTGLSIDMFKYLVHGIPEILAYFIAGLAGGLISVAIIRHTYTTQRFSSVLKDSVYLMILALGVLLGAALMEVYITPVLFS